MADFQQRGVLTTLHQFESQTNSAMRTHLADFRSARPIGLVLPALIGEFQRPAMRWIRDCLQSANYIDRIVVAVGDATFEQAMATREFFHGMEPPVTILWVEDPRINSICNRLERAGYPAGMKGKGRACWLAYGYLLAQSECEIVATHDCDISNYSDEMLMRLLYPLAHPDLNFLFSKGYYARVTGQLYGRVTRLFIAPLLAALRELLPDSRFLRFLEEFRYPLAGECAFRSSVLDRLQLSANWGLEIGTLHEVFRSVACESVCQVDVASNYEHKHQKLSAEDATRGLNRMARDISVTLLRALALDPVAPLSDQLPNLESLYAARARNFLKRYEADAILNGLEFDAASEWNAISTFSGCLAHTRRDYETGRLDAPLLPSWNWIRSSFPGILSSLLECGVDAGARRTFSYWSPDDGARNTDLRPQVL